MTFQSRTDSPVTNVPVLVEEILLHIVAKAEELDTSAFRSNYGKLTRTQLEGELPAQASVCTGQHHSLHPGSATSRKLPLPTHIHWFTLLLTDKDEHVRIYDEVSQKAPWVQIRPEF